MLCLSSSIISISLHCVPSCHPLCGFHQCALFNFAPHQNNKHTFVGPGGWEVKGQPTGSPQLEGNLRMRKGAGGLNPWEKRPNWKYKIRRNMYFQVKIYDMYKHTVCYLCMQRLRCVSLRQYSQAGCLRWSSSWAPPMFGQWTTYGQSWTFLPMLPGLAGACSVSGAQRKAPCPLP